MLAWWLFTKAQTPQNCVFSSKSASAMQNDHCVHTMVRTVCVPVGIIYWTKCVRFKMGTSNKTIHILQTLDVILISFEFYKFLWISIQLSCPRALVVISFFGNISRWWYCGNGIAILGLLNFVYTYLRVCVCQCVLVHSPIILVEKFSLSFWHNKTTTNNHQTLLQHLNVLKCDLTHSKIKYSEIHLAQNFYWTVANVNKNEFM